MSAPRLALQRRNTVASVFKIGSSLACALILVGGALAFGQEREHGGPQAHGGPPEQHGGPGARAQFPYRPLPPAAGLGTPPLGLRRDSPAGLLGTEPDRRLLAVRARSTAGGV